MRSLRQDYDGSVPHDAGEEGRPYLTPPFSLFLARSLPLQLLREAEADPRNFAELKPRTAKLQRADVSARVHPSR